MTAYYKTTGFVFKKSDLNDSDQIFSVFTRDFGKLDIFAKAIRKSTSKLRGAMDIFFMSDIEFIQGKNRKTLTDADTLEKFSNLTQSPEKFEIATSIGEVLDNFLKGQEPDENIFNLINETFKILNTSSSRLQDSILYYYFLWNFLSVLGYKPEVKNCCVCHDKLTPYSIYFSQKLGGAICKKCFAQDNNAVKTNSDIIKILRLIINKDWTTLSKIKIPTVSQNLFKKISNGYYVQILDKVS